MSAVSTIRNLGPALEARFARAGITTAEEIRALGADAAYARLLEAGFRPHFMGFMALALGLQDRRFDDASKEEKIALRVRFDALRKTQPAGGDPDSGIEAILDQIGTGARR